MAASLTVRAAGAPLTAATTLPLQRVLAVGIGNALEFYDFLTFSFFAIQIGHTFFPEQQTSHGLLYTLATFGVGFITRPLGAIVIGRLGDRVGRKPAMLWSFGLMGVGIVGIALTPSYAQIGIAAPILLLCFRLIQGFALGGEVGSSTAYFVEVAPAHRRGLYVSLQAASQGVAILAAGLVGAILARQLGVSQLDAWGWRLAFLLGASVVPVGLYIRRRLPETMHQQHKISSGARAALPIRLLLLSLFILGAMTITTYVVSYLATYSQDTLHLAAGVGFGATIVQGLTILVVGPLCGGLSDRLGRKPLMLCGACLLLLLAVPGFFLLNALRTPIAVIALSAALTSAQQLMAIPAFAMIAESLPQSLRCSGFSIVYAVAIAVFGGTTQFIVKGLIELTDNPITPGWYLTAALVMGLVAALALRESAPIRVPEASFALE